MRAVIQRVTKAGVSVAGETVGEIGNGIVALIGIGADDTEDEIPYLADKIVNLRIFDDENDKMNFSLLDIRGELLIISQFTLYGDCRKGKRPSYDKAAKPEDAEMIYERFVEYCRKYDINIQTGKFRAMMSVDITNSGPVTLMLESRGG